MQFDSLAALWWMNGHGPLVWVPLQKQRRFFAEQRGIEHRRSLRQPAPPAHASEPKAS